MDVTFVLKESGVTATVEVPCEANAAAAKEIACTALSVLPASVAMRIGTQVLEGTCRLQDTAFGQGVQVVLTRRFADIKCPAKYTATHVGSLSLSCCGTLCVYVCERNVVGFDTETFDTVFSFEVDSRVRGPPAISQCKTRCFLTCRDHLLKVALPSGEVLRKADGISKPVFACGSVVVSKGTDGVSVYDEDLTLLRSLSHELCRNVAVTHCGGWVITSSGREHNVRLWDVHTGEVVACVPAGRWWRVALSRSAAVFALGEENGVHLYDWSGAALGIINVGEDVQSMQFTPCGKYLVVRNFQVLHQYDVATMSCVHVIPHTVKIFILGRNKTGTPQKIVDCSSFVPYQHCFGGVSVPCQKKRGVRRIFFCPKMHYAPGWGGNGDKNTTPTELFWAGTKLGHPQKPQVFQFCSGPVYFCLRIVTAQNKYFYGNPETSFAISPCSRVLVAMQLDGVILTTHLYPHNSESDVS